jgi:hypothetical protein
MQIGVLYRQASNGLGDGGVLLGPVVAPAGQDMHSAGVEPSVHGLSAELDLVQRAGALRRRLHQFADLRLVSGQTGRMAAQCIIHRFRY